MRAHSFVLHDRVLAVAGLLALAAAYLTPLANAEWTAWRPDHGHLTLSGAVPTHTHPWEMHASPAPGAAPSDDLAGPRASEQDGLVYQGNSEGVPGIAALWTTPVDTSAVRVSEMAAPAAPDEPPASVSVLPSTPPPRG